MSTQFKLPNAAEYANQAFFVPVSNRIVDPLTKGNTGVYVSDGKKWHDVSTQVVPGSVPGFSTTLDLEDVRSVDNVVAGEIDMGGFNIINAADPTAAQHLATKAYVDAQVGAISVDLASVSAASDTTIKSLYTMTSGIDVDFQDSSGNTILYLDEAQRRVGVNTNSPEAVWNAKINVSDFRFSEGASNVTPTISVINTNASGKAAALLAGTGGSTFSFDEAGHFSIRSEAKANFLNNVTGIGTVHFFIDSAGDISIGYGLSPAARKLDVNGTGRFTGALTVGAYTIPNTDGTNNQVLSTDGSGNVTWESLSSIHSHAFTDLTDTPANYTSSAGYFAMVNATPNAIEFVDPSTIDLSSFNDDLGHYWQDDGSGNISNTNAGNVTASGILFDDQFSATKRITFGSGSIAMVNSGLIQMEIPNSTLFRVKLGSIETYKFFNNRFIIDNTSRLGLGVSPSHQFHQVATTDNGSVISKWQDLNNIDAMSLTDSGDLTLNGELNATDGIFTNSATIGDGSSTALLSLISDNSSSSGINFVLSDGVTVRGSIHMDSDEDIIFQNNSTDEFYFKTPSGNKVRIGNTGDVDIYTGSLSVTDAVVSGDQTNILSLLSSGNNSNADRGSAILFGTDAGANRGRIGVGNEGTSTANSYIRFETANSGTLTEAARITSNQNLLIGTTTDSGHKLDVSGKIGIDGTQMIYYPQGDFTGTLVIGNGGGSLSHGSGLDGTFNTFVGIGVGSSNTTGHTNIGVGYQSLNTNIIGAYNVAIGTLSLGDNTNSYNTAIGNFSLRDNTSGRQNTAIGYGALYSNTTGRENIAIGYFSGRYITDGSTANETSSDSLYLGTSTKALADGGTNEIVIGYDATGLGSNTAVLGNDSITTTALKGNVLVGTTTDSGYKLDVNGAGRFSNTVRVDAFATDIGYHLYDSATGNLTLRLSDEISGADQGGRLLMFKNGVFYCQISYRHDNIFTLDTSRKFIVKGPSSDLLDLDHLGRLSLIETTAPSLTANYGKFYASSVDNLAHFLDSSGNDYNIVTDIAGQDSSALAQAPTATEDGFVLAWDETASEYDLVDVNTLASTNIGQTFYVDTINGNNATAEEGNLLRTYASLAYVYDNETLGSGDIVVIMNGTDNGAGKSINIWNGAVVVRDGATLSNYNFTDSAASDITFHLTGSADYSSGNLFNLSNTNTTIYASGEKFTGSASLVSMSAGAAGQNLYIDYEKMSTTAGTLFSMQQTTNCEVIINFKNAYAGNRLFYLSAVSSGDKVYVNGQYALSEGGSNMSVRVMSGEVYMDIMEHDVHNTGTNAVNERGFLTCEQGGFIKYKGRVNFTNPDSYAVFAKSNCTIDLSEAEIIYEDVTSTLPAVQLNGNSTVCRLGKVRNENQSATSHAVRSGITSAVDNTVELRASKIEIDSTAEGLGAKQISASASLNVHADSLAELRDLTNITNTYPYQKDTEVALTDGDTWDLTEGSRAVWTLTADNALDISNAKPGTYKLTIVTAGNAATFTPTIKWSSGTIPTINSDTALIELEYTNSGWHGKEILNMS